MSAQLTGYICVCCGFTIIELKPVSPLCPVCVEWGCIEGRLVEVANAAEVKYLAVTLHLSGRPEFTDVAFERRPATD